MKKKRLSMSDHEKMIERFSMEYRESYSRINDPSAWFESAEELRFAAQTLSGSIKKLCENDNNDWLGLTPSYMMLIGYALENMLKCLIVHRDGKIKDKHMNGHDLLGLFKDSGIRSQHDFTKLLKQLTLFCRWAGRYPAAKSADGMGDPVDKIIVPSIHIDKCDELYRLVAKEARKCNGKSP
ncbi:MAG: hypothetical protein GDA68_22490 [Nitrospira sp. CR2.1]|nr:hypothetical protein [Nitrospira sp. CR2.1]